MFTGFAPRGGVAGRARRRHLVAVLAFDGVVLGDLATPCEVFGRVRDADGQSLYEVRVCSSTARVRSEHVTLSVRWRLSSARHADTVVAPGVDDVDRPIPNGVLLSIRRALARGARVASVCTGAFLLGAAGVLAGRRATTHWCGSKELARRHPDVEVDANVLYVDNGNVLTSAGAAAGLDLCLHLVRRDFGAEIAAEAARAAVMPLERAGGQSQFIVHESPARDDASLASLLTWVDRNLAGDLSLPTLARNAAMSTRTLSRRFRLQIGATPAAWIARVRVRRAQQLLETTNLAVERIAEECGFRSATVLREHFGRIVGTPPLAYRRSFRARSGTATPTRRGGIARRRSARS
jgi:transcriptional regulator GlxA family with amidase domain